MIDYKGNTLLELLSIVKANPNYTMAEILHSVIRPSNLRKLLLECSDEDLYSAVERARSSFDETDEVLNEQEWNNYIDTKFN